MRPTKLVAAMALCTAVLLSGCAGLQPGVAARVGDETIDVSDVNRITDGYCLAYERQLESEGNVLPRDFLAGNILFRLALSAAARQLAADYGVEPTAAYTDSLATLKQTVAVLTPAAAEARLAVDSSGTYVDDILGTIGRQQLEEDGVADPTAEDSLARGRDVLRVWLTENEPDIDPQYGLEVNDLQPDFIETGTSLAASDSARLAARAHLLFGSPDLTEDEQRELADYARSLPSSQRCG